MSKPILCLDFDGVVHKYSRGWQGEDALYDPVTPGFFEWAARAHARFRLVVYSSRSRRPAGALAMKNWLYGQFTEWCGHGSEVRAEDDRVHYYRWDRVDQTDPHPLFTLSFAHEKPAAFLTIDDRCLQFRGDWAAWWLEPARLAEFRPWNAEGYAPGPCVEPEEPTIERVARAICAKACENIGVYWGLDPISVAVERDWVDYRDQAIAALGAVGKVDELNPWRPIDTAPKNEWVEVTGDSGVGAPPHFLALAKRDAAYRPLDHWRDVQLVSLSYQGWTPTHWRRASTFPEVRAVDGDVQ